MLASPVAMMKTLDQLTTLSAYKIILRQADSCIFTKYNFYFTGYKGNLTENVPIVIVSLVFSIVSFFGVLYLLLWQTYVLRADVILTSIEIVFIGLEMILCVVCAIIFLRW